MLYIISAKREGVKQLGKESAKTVKQEWNILAHRGV
jgi:hypothetical protein